MLYIGIDPGKKGGIGIINGEDAATALPLSIDNMINVLYRINPDEIKVFVEKIHAMPGQGVTSMFSFGENFGIIKGILCAYKIKAEFVPPQTWKKHFNLLKCDKQASIDCAKLLYPDINLIPDGKRTEQDGLAEALLIARYGRDIQ